MQWPEGAFDKYLSTSARWLLHLMAFLVLTLLAYDLFANRHSSSGPTSWVQTVILGGVSRKLAFALLLLLGCTMALGMAFLFDMITRQGVFEATEANSFRRTDGRE